MITFFHDIPISHLSSFPLNKNKFKNLRFFVVSSIYILKMVSSEMLFHLKYKTPPIKKTVLSMPYLVSILHTQS